MNRYRVRAPAKKWIDKGPDLLRKEDNAVKALKALLDPGADIQLATRRERPDGTFTDWEPAVSRPEVVDRFRAWDGTDKADIFQVGRVLPAGDIELLTAVKFEFVALTDTSCVSDKTVVARSLIEHQFPGIKFAGGYVWKQINGSTSWSDHAWGTAIDETHNPPGVTNDEVTHWIARMAQTGNVDFDYALGSRDGKVVVVAAPDFEIEPSGASDSHLWHNHVSTVDHDGAKPPKEDLEC